MNKPMLLLGPPLRARSHSDTLDAAPGMPKPTPPGNPTSGSVAVPYTPFALAFRMTLSASAKASHRASAEVNIVSSSAKYAGATRCAIFSDTACRVSRSFRCSMASSLSIRLISSAGLTGSVAFSAALNTAAASAKMRRLRGSAGICFSISGLRASRAAMRVNIAATSGESSTGLIADRSRESGVVFLRCFGICLSSQCMHRLHASQHGRLHTLAADAGEHHRRRIRRERPGARTVSFGTNSLNRVKIAASGSPAARASFISGEASNSHHAHGLVRGRC